MKTLELKILLTYDDDVMHSSDLSPKEFFNMIAQEDLILHSNFIGDSVGFVDILQTEELD